jgi:hypothetical protein
VEADLTGTRCAFEMYYGSKYRRKCNSINLLTYLLTPRSTVLLEKLTGNSINTHKKRAAFRAHLHETCQTEQQYVKISHTELHTNIKKKWKAHPQAKHGFRDFHKADHLFCVIIVHQVSSKLEEKYHEIL